MKISIITVTHNAAKTIRETIESVACQQNADIEHIIIDGGSKDGTQEIVKSFGTRIAAFISEPDRGIYDAMNKGIALATGDVIGFLNADDRYAHNQVITWVAALMVSDNLDALYGDVAFFRNGAPERIVRRYRSSHFHPSRIAWGWMPAHPALFVHQRIFKQIGAFNPDYHIAGDFEFIARAFQSGKLRYRYIPEVLVEMRIGGVSTKGWRNTLLLNREVLRACHENGIYTNPFMILSKYPLKLMEFIVPKKLSMGKSNPPQTLK